MGRRDKWTGLALNTDHPLRLERNIRDETIAVKTVKSDKTGRHPDEIIYDDLVVPNNAYTETGRSEVRRGASEAVSLAKSNALMTAAGTVYHPMDQYALWKDSLYSLYTEDGKYLKEANLWHVVERKVEDQGDGTGQYLWPRVWNPTLKEWFGWDIQSLSKKKAEYINNGEGSQFYAQYYMEANDPSSYRVRYDQFNYINPKFLLWKQTHWEYNGKKLTIGLFIDAASTDAASRNAKKNDFTAMGVIGIDTEGFYYVLHLEQFQTDKRTVYYDYMIQLWKRWGFQRATFELEGAGRIIAEAMKEQLRRDGYSLIVEGYPAPRGLSKAERHASVTIPRYEQGIVLHVKGGWTTELEEQIVKERPAHDDLLDVVTMGIEKLKQPYRSTWSFSDDNASGNVIAAHARFGGRRG
jgi:phage terminase large subunit-like protein